MASAALHLPLQTLPFRKPLKTRLLHPSSLISRHPTNLSPPNSLSFPPNSTKLGRRLNFITSAYVAAPASDPNISENEPKFGESGSTGTVQSPPATISWGLVLSLLLQHKLQLAVSVATLIGCTTCTLTMPILSGVQGVRLEAPLEAKRM